MVTLVLELFAARTLGLIEATAFGLCRRVLTLRDSRQARAKFQFARAPSRPPILRSTTKNSAASRRWSEQNLIALCCASRAAVHGAPAVGCNEEDSGWGISRVKVLDCRCIAMKLSVVMPVYNERVTLREIIKKVLAVPIDLELLCVDDGSHDGSREILGELQGQHAQLRVILQPENLGKG
jgi:hypothetical protein